MVDLSNSWDIFQGLQVRDRWLACMLINEWLAVKTDIAGDPQLSKRPQKKRMVGGRSCFSSVKKGGLKAAAHYSLGSYYYPGS